MQVRHAPRRPARVLALAALTARPYRSTRPLGRSKRARPIREPPRTASNVSPGERTAWLLAAFVRERGEENRKRAGPPKARGRPLCDGRAVQASKAPRVLVGHWPRLHIGDFNSQPRTVGRRAWFLAWGCRRRAMWRFLLLNAKPEERVALPRACGGPPTHGSSKWSSFCRRTRAGGAGIFLCASPPFVCLF